MAKLTFTKQQKLMTSAQFSHVFNHAKAVRDKHSLVLYTNNDLAWPRLGTIIAKKKVAKATTRNQIKRIIRESFRYQQHELGNVDIVVLAKPGLANLTKHELRQYFDKQWQRLRKYQH